VTEERRCTTCSETLDRYGHFVRTSSGFRHAACPPDPATVAAAERAPALDDESRRDRRSAAMKEIWARKREKRSAARAAEDAARSSTPAPDEDLNLYDAAIAPSRHYSCPPPVTETEINASDQETEAPTVGPRELCTRCDLPLADSGQFRRASYGQLHLTCPPKRNRPAAQCAPRLTTPEVAPPARKGFCTRCGQPLGEFGAKRHTLHGLRHAICPRKPPRAAPPLPPLPPVTQGPAPAATMPEPEPEDDTGTRCARCRRPLGAFGVWVGSAAGRVHAACPSSVRVVAIASPEEAS
jgi:hypothetical protein